MTEAHEGMSAAEAPEERTDRPYTAGQADVPQDSPATGQRDLPEYVPYRGSAQEREDQFRDERQSQYAADAGSFGDRSRVAQPGASDTSSRQEEFTHYVHLADGRVINHNLTEPLGPAFIEGEGDDQTSTQIIGVYPK